MKRFLIFVLTLGFIAPLFMQMGFGVAGTAAAVIGAVLLATFSTKNRHGLQLNDAMGDGLDLQVWLPNIQEELFKDNEFLLRSVNHSEYVNNLTVNVPQSGAGRPWVKNRDHSANLAGGSAVTRRTDTVLTYNIHEWTADPAKVTRLEDTQLSYNKRMSVLGQMMSTGKQQIAEDTLYEWSPSLGTYILRTSGIRNNDIDAGPYATAMGNVTGAAGTRNVFGMYDMKRANTAFTKMKIGTQGWCCAMSADRYQELMDDVITTKYRDAASYMDMKNGVMNKILNFDIYIRPDIVSYTNDGTPVKKAPGAASDAADNDAVIFWSEGQVARAIGENELFYNPGQAVHFGDIMTGLIRAGGSRLRSTQIGTLAIVQSHGA